MKSLSASIKVATLFVLMTGGGYVVWKNIGADVTGGEAKQMWARFKDASGLPVGSKVVVAGLPVGEITGHSIEGRYARVNFKVRSDIPIYDSAIVLKKATSLLGNHFLEIDPGAEDSVAANGTRLHHAQLGAGSQIPQVVESTNVDELLRRVEQTMPRVDKVLVSVNDLSEDMRRVVNGPIASVAAKVDALVQKEASTVSTILARADRSMARIEQITKDIRAISGGADAKVANILDNLEAASAEAKLLVSSAKSEVEATGAKVRDKLDKVDGILANTESITDKIDDNQGTLGRLVNDSAIADNVEDITADAKDFLGTVFKLKTYVGLRTEFNIASRLMRHYVAIELHTRPDKFYYLEIEKGPRGGYPDTTLTYDPTVDPDYWVRKSVIEDKFRFTFQFAKRFDFATLRYGVKESTGGVGLDLDGNWLNRGLRFSLDIFDATFDKWPRVKLTAAVEMFRHLYVIGGVDELINPPGTLEIATGTDSVPLQFEQFRYGRDYFFGAMLKFHDEDLAALLAVGGSALGAAGGN